MIEVLNYHQYIHPLQLFLNIDVNSLVDEVIGKYFGFVTEGMTLLGETSGSQATVSSVKLIPRYFWRS